MGSGYITASGQPVSTKTVAVDPNVVPLGTILELKYPDGHTETRVAEDTGSAIVGNKLDVFVWSESQAITNGVQTVQARIIGYKHL